ncbi:MAG: ribonuclease HII [Pseudomonadota bacterium]
MQASLPADCVLVGCDEVGRGPLAGDVVAAAVYLGPYCRIDGLRDSKKLSEKRRNELAEKIWTEASAVAIGRATPQEIDRVNILRASLLAMARAVDSLGIDVGFIAVDGRHLPAWDYPAMAVVKGDDRVEAIAAASIVAKVARDREMCELHEAWPVYGFDRHKGYPTAQHLKALRDHGPTPLHRRSFGPVQRALALLNQGD